MVDFQAYIYYYDWGPNSGTNWMIGDSLGSSSRVLETFNLETKGKTTGTECPVMVVGWPKILVSAPVPLELIGIWV